MPITLISPYLLQTPHGVVEIGDPRGDDELDIMQRGAQHRLMGEGPPLIDQVHPLTFSLGARAIDTTFAALQQISRLRELAKRAAEKKAISYRIKVGAAACVVSRDGLRFVHAGNYKPYKGGPRECAEARVFAEIDRGMAGHPEHVAVLAVHGPDDFRDIDDFPSTTLHPCGVTCRPMLRGRIAQGALVTPQTVIVTESYGGEVEVHELGELLDKHAVQDGVAECYNLL